MRDAWGVREGRVRGGERMQQDKTKRELGRDMDPENTCLHNICGVSTRKSVVGKKVIVNNTLSKDRFANKDRIVFGIS